jgi:hypothetical protein
MDEAKAMAMVVMAKAASSISNATEVACTVPQCLSILAHASPAECLAIGSRTAKQTRQRVPPPPCPNNSRREKRRPVMLTSVALGPALSSNEKTDKDASLSRLHLMVPVDLCKSLGSKDYYP